MPAEHRLLGFAGPQWAVEVVVVSEVVGWKEVLRVAQALQAFLEEDSKSLSLSEPLPLVLLGHEAATHHVLLGWQPLVLLHPRHIRTQACVVHRPVRTTDKHPWIRRRRINSLCIVGCRVQRTEKYFHRIWVGWEV